jgi:type IV pilus assembly protein PilA
MMRRRKDSGFTLIELMIVIAVIGILAIVLIPKIGTVKAQAKETGLDTNIRVIQGYVESKIDKWVQNGTANSDVAQDIKLAFSDDRSLSNPFTSRTAPAVLEAAASGDDPVIISQDWDPESDPADPEDFQGTVVVSIIGGGAAGTPIDGVKIYAYDDRGVIIFGYNKTREGPSPVDNISVFG